MQEPSTSPESDAPFDIESVARCYSKHLARFRFEKAVEYIEDVRKTPLNDAWPLLFNTMSQVSVCFVNLTNPVIVRDRRITLFLSFLFLL
jgi:hypothetical protein